MNEISVEIFGARGREYCAIVLLGKCEVYRIDFIGQGVKETGKLDGYTRAAGRG